VYITITVHLPALQDLRKDGRCFGGLIFALSPLTCTLGSSRNVLTFKIDVVCIMSIPTSITSQSHFSAYLIGRAPRLSCGLATRRCMMCVGAMCINSERRVSAALHVIWDCWSNYSCTKHIVVTACGRLVWMCRTVRYPSQGPFPCWR
jgi:hypothetical protein